MDHPNNPTNGLIASRDWTLERLLNFGPRLRTVDRISINSETPDQITPIIKLQASRTTNSTLSRLWHVTFIFAPIDQTSSPHITELIDSLHGSPPFAQPEGVTYLPYTCDFNKPLFQNPNICVARIRTVQNGGEAGPSGPLESRLMWSYQELPVMFFRRSWEFDGLLGSF